MIFFIVISFLVSILSIFLGLLVFFKDTKNLINRTFLFYTVSVFLWSFPYGVWLLQTNAKDALFWSRMLNFGAIFIPLAFLHWVLVFLGKNNIKKYKIVLILAYSFSIIFALFSFTDAYIKGVAPISIFPYWPQSGWLYFVYLITNYVGMLALGNYLLYRGIVTSKGVFKEQIRYSFFGSMISFIGGASNFPLMIGVDSFLPVGNFLTIAFPLVFTYTIITRHLMNIKIILRKMAVSFFTMGFFLSVYIFVKWFFFVYYPFIAFYAEVLVLFFSLMFVIRVSNYFYSFSNKYLFSAVYDINDIMSEINESVGFDSNLDNIYDKIYGILEKSFHFKAFGVLEYDKKHKMYFFKYFQGFKPGNKKTIKVSDVLHKFFIVEGKDVTVKNLKQHYYNESTKETIDFFIDMGIEVLVPLNARDKVIGLIMIGKKETKEVYTKEDIKLIHNISVKIASNIEYIRGYETVVKQNKEMEKKIEIATRDLKDKNKKLGKLDKTKNSFINLASHQLRNPLFVIKGYLSMVREGMFGANTKLQEEQLVKISQSNESLIQLIEDLLNVERIKSGRLEFNFVKVDFNVMVDNVFNELKLNAKKKNLKFRINKPKKPLPKIMADKVKLKQVVFNLIDNAIKYTDKGSVTIYYERVGNRIKFWVSDSGKGISDYGINRLFKKFSRYTGQKLHVEGTGLGLYIAKQMVEHHNGKMWAKSAGEGRGSQFYFTLPLKQSKKRK